MMPCTLTVPMHASLTAIRRLLEDGSGGVLYYSGFVGWNEAVVRTRCQLVDRMGGESVVALFEPDALSAAAAAPTWIGISWTVARQIELRFGRLWAPDDGGSAALIPYAYAPGGPDQEPCHYAVHQGRIARRLGWPGADLPAGYERATRRLAELTAAALADASVREG